MRVLAVCMLVSLLAPFGFGQETTAKAPVDAAGNWARYVPKKESGNFLRPPTSKASQPGSASGTDFVTLVTWLTETAARSFVSRQLDKERLTPNEAEERFQTLRPDDVHIVLVTLKYLDISGKKNTDRRPSDPLEVAECFLRRRDDRTIFSGAVLVDSVTDYKLGGAPDDGPEHFYVLQFSATSRDGKAIVRDLKDEIEVQVKIEGKVLVFNYKLKDMASSIDEL
jgi:hypothetical protein